MAGVCILDSDRERKEQLAASVRNMLSVPDQVERLKALLDSRHPAFPLWQIMTDNTPRDVRRWTKEGFPVHILVIHLDLDDCDVWEDLWDDLRQATNLPPGLCVLFWIDCRPCLDETLSDYEIHKLGKSILDVQKKFSTEGFAVPPFTWVFPSPQMNMRPRWLAHTLRFLRRVSNARARLSSEEQKMRARCQGIIEYSLTVPVDLGAFSSIVARHSGACTAVVFNQWLRMAVCLTEVHLVEQLRKYPIPGSHYVTGITEMSDGGEEAVLRAWNRGVDASLYVTCEMQELAEFLPPFYGARAQPDEAPSNCVRIGISPSPLLNGHTGVGGVFNYIGAGLDNAKLLSGCDRYYRRILVDRSCPVKLLKRKYTSILGKHCFEPISHTYAQGRHVDFYAVLESNRQINV